jgi:hypothetical protein
MPKIVPRCPENYTLDKSSLPCKCVKMENKKTKNKKPASNIKTSTSKNKKRCKKGTRKNKTTGICEPYKRPNDVYPNLLPQPTPKQPTPKQPTPKQPTPTPLPLPSYTKKQTRCPKGTRKNKKTGKCETYQVNKNITNKINKNITNKINNNIIISNSTPQADRYLGKAIQELVTNKQINLEGKSEQLSSNISQIRGELIKQKSFSPTVNKRLVSIHKDIMARDIFGCGLEKIFNNKSYNQSLAWLHKKADFKIKVGVNQKTNKPICMSIESPKAIEILLNNLKATGKFNCSLVTAPLQVKANCWFNTMFMTFFVSDKGRKFFRFFRQLMIEGKQEDGTRIKPSALRYAFLLLNTAIEAAYNVTGSNDVMDLAYSMDTNNIIMNIFKSMPIKGKKSGKIKGVDESGNPLSYYRGIIDYLGNNSLKLHKISLSSQVANRLFPSASAYKLLSVAKLPSWFNDSLEVISDIFVFEIYDDSKEGPGESKAIDNRPLKMVTKEGHEYVLDAAVIRDTTGEHFASVLTCNGEEKGFDGASLSRVSKFSWKQYINTDKNWTFVGSNWNNKEGNPIWWNFRNGYQLLFYYRQK